MKEILDNFSQQSDSYKKYRPTYPTELYNEILAQVSQLRLAWDVGTGNGQTAIILADHFDQVIATDISANQIKQAPQRDNIDYSVQRAEQSDLTTGSADLITVSQAIHWFDLDTFYEEVSRVSAPDGIIAVWGYGHLSIDADIDPLLSEFYHDIVGPYWDPERSHVDAAYQSIRFPFRPIPDTRSQFDITDQWTRDQLYGYLNSWSSVQHYIRANGNNPVDTLMTKINEIWPSNHSKPIHFPVFLLLARVHL